jgi:hypothetical protein
MQDSSAVPDLRYPIGKFPLPSTISREDRNRFIEDIAALPGQLRHAIDGLGEARLDTAYRPGGWTVRQVVHHLADSHMNAYVRFKLALTEDNPTVKPYKEDRWAELPEARTAPVEVSLTLLDGMHHRWVMMARAMSDAEFARTFHHPERGAMRLDLVAAMYAWHCRHHVAHITSLRQRLGW